MMCKIIEPTLGCIGIPRLELGALGQGQNPDLSNSFSTFEQAKKEAAKVEKDIKNIELGRTTA
jgi:hypothetical protein